MFIKIIKMLRRKKELKLEDEYLSRQRDRLFISNNVKYRGIGGKKGYIDRIITVDEILEKLLKGNMAAYYFTKRRPDLFRNFDDLRIPDNELIKEKAKSQNMKYYYVKVRNGKDEHIYLGYIVASDEVTKYIKKGMRDE